MIGLGEERAGVSVVWKCVCMCGVCDGEVMVSHSKGA